MTNYTYTTGIPNGSLTPAQNRPTMTTNNDSNFNIWTEDHHGFNNNQGGAHKFMRMPEFTNPAVISSTGTQGGVVYDAAGIASTTNPQVFFKNGLGTFLLSGIRAFGFVNSAGAIQGGQSLNVTSVTKINGTGRFTVNLTANAVSSANYVVLAMCARNASGHSVVCNLEGIGVSSFEIITISAETHVVSDPNSLAFLAIQI